MAVGVVAHKATDVRLICRIGQRLVVAEMSRIITPIVGRTPRLIVIDPHRAVDERRTIVCGLHNVVLAIHIRVAHHLHVVSRLLALYDEGGNILKDVLGQYGLQDNDVNTVFVILKHTQIIYVAIAIEVKVVDSFGLRIEQHLKRLYIA